jgi:predicted transposase YdaD
LLAHGRWFSPGTPASSITKTGRYDIAEILMKVALNTKNQSIILTSVTLQLNKYYALTIDELEKHLPHGDMITNTLYVEKAKQ